MNIEIKLSEIAFKKKIHLNLENIIKATKKFNNPHEKLKCIHIAGTNGKGTTADFIAQYLEQMGYKVGLYSSPHLISYTERLKINNQEINQNKLEEYLKKIENEKLELTEFEILTLIAFLYFEDEEVDYVVLETGLGGRLDATNIITPLCSVITSISLDHSEYLGNSILDITKEKLGIIKSKIPVFIGKQTQEVIEIINNQKIENRLIWLTGTYDNYLNENQELAKLVIKNLFPEHNCEELVETRLNARFQIIKKFPYFIVDAAHNLGGIKYLLKQLKLKGDFVIVYAATKRNELKEILELLNRNCITLICVEFDFYRSVKLEQYQNVLGEKAIYIMQKELELTLKKYSKNNICITGSIYFIGQELSKFL